MSYPSRLAGAEGADMMQLRSFCRASPTQALKLRGRRSSPLALRIERYARNTVNPFGNPASIRAAREAKLHAVPPPNG